MKLIPIVQEDKTIYKCTCCDQVYDELPLCFGAEAPGFCNTIPVSEREQRIEFEKSLCVVDKKHFFHRGRLIIPIIDHDNQLIFDVWTSISEKNFERRMDLWNNPDRTSEPPYFGWLDTIVPGYRNTLNLKTMAQEQEPGTIPDIYVTENDHPLSIDQQKGITMNKVLDIVSIILKHNN
jgi:Uncharacterized protein conserved in bacteria